MALVMAAVLAFTTLASDARSHGIVQPPADFHYPAEEPAERASAISALPSLVAVPTRNRHNARENATSLHSDDIRRGSASHARLQPSPVFQDNIVDGGMTPSTSAHLKCPGGDGVDVEVGSQLSCDGFSWMLVAAWNDDGGVNSLPHSFTTNNLLYLFAHLFYIHTLPPPTSSFTSLISCAYAGASSYSTVTVISHANMHAIALTCSTIST